MHAPENPTLALLLVDRDVFLKTVRLVINVKALSVIIVKVESASRHQYFVQLLQVEIDIIEVEMDKKFI